MLVKKSTKRSGFIIFCDASPYKTLLRTLVAFSYVLSTLHPLDAVYFKTPYCK